MGACCSKDGMDGSSGRFMEEHVVVQRVYDHQPTKVEDEEENVQYGDCGARIRLQGCSEFTSMYTQQGRKGINQDAMTVWQVRKYKFGFTFELSLPTLIVLFVKM